MPNDTIAFIGVELEGGWNVRPDRLKGDGSVHVGSSYDGEVSSPKLTLAELASFLSKYYPVEVNATCGMHVHMSYKNKSDYLSIISNDFMLHLKEELEAWGTLHCPKFKNYWTRIKGNNQYCRWNYIPGNVLSQNNKYTAVHYSYPEHGTVECRILPMFPTAKEALPAILKVVEIFNNWPKTHKVKPYKKEIEFMTPTPKKKSVKKTTTTAKKKAPKKKVPFNIIPPPPVVLQEEDRW